MDKSFSDKVANTFDSFIFGAEIPPANNRFRKIKELLLEETPLEPTKNTLYAFMDGSGQDNVDEGHLDEWHTWAMVQTNAAKLLSRDFENFTLMPGIRIRKWSGINPKKPKAKASRAARSSYRSKFMSIFGSDKLNCPITVIANSYTGRQLFDQRDQIFNSIQLHPYDLATRRGYHLYTDRNFRTIISVHYSDAQSIKMPLGNFLVLANLFLMVSTFYELLHHNYRKLDGMILVSDPLCGDQLGQDGKKEHGKLLQAFLDWSCAGRIRFHNVSEQDTYVGELLADNFSGMLNRAAEKGEISKEIWAMENSRWVSIIWLGQLDGQLSKDCISKDIFKQRSPSSSATGASEDVGGLNSGRAASSAPRSPTPESYQIR